MSSVGFRIAPLAAHPHWTAQLADWHYAEWGALYAGAWRHADALRELREQAVDERIPATWVAHDGAALLGSVSLVHEDADALRELGSPWLASLYVRPEARGRGCGRALHDHALVAAALQGVSVLRLFTAQHADWYRRLGWHDECAACVGGQPVQVLRCEPPRGIAA